MTVAAPPPVRRAPVPPLQPRIRRELVDAAAVVAGLGFGAALALPIANETASAYRAPGGPAILFGNITAMGGTWLLLIMLLLAARIPTIESVVGHDRMLRWHRLLSPWPLALLSAHAFLTTVGYAQSARTGTWHQAGVLLSSYSWMVAATASWLMLLAIAAVSIRIARRRIAYDTWWVIHLYTYLAVALSFLHQIFDGSEFVGHQTARTAWIVVWLATAGVVLVSRVGLPVLRTARHQMQVQEVRREGKGVISLILTGRDLDQLGAAGGQFFSWRFLTRGLWWHAHPFSLSAAPTRTHMRVTIKTLGDTTAILARLRPGTRVAIEGPYGVFTDAHRVHNRVALFAAGVGITPVRALLEEIPAGVDVITVVRASKDGDLLFRKEITDLVAHHRGRLIEMVGPRTRNRLDPVNLHKLIPDLATRDVFVCGPDGFANQVEHSARYLGVGSDALHREIFEF
ncbi:ferric reductase-like transmembrane domain-containing protein [Acidiferrimicrobium sp. IK]|uniref:ferredoxin reductase family protein n=1 Tax=Acidiferrimicrobium sp. IK TaxID=2871700 RepID=UPI0021CB7974|nr:ferredoxin reductase family protein [Acidiferrimicrobium sp. IK]MCU4186253.1 ferric reductase-like transmembrane domain-containing protein [Acidiferrimicrobium sp. IK]